MKQVQILIDSACDMQQPEAERLGVTLLPLRTNFDGEVFLDGVDLSHEAFFEKLTQSKTLPTTSQVPPYDYEKAYRQAQKAGGEILVITISSRLSGTYQSAVIAAQQTGADVTIIDSENVTAGERVLVEYALRLVDEGQGAAQVAADFAQRTSRRRWSRQKAGSAFSGASIRWNIYTAAAGSPKQARSPERFWAFARC